MDKINHNNEIYQEKLKLLDIFLKNASFNGWNNQTLEKSAQQCGFNKGYLSLLFPNQIKDLTSFFYNKKNDELISLYKEKSNLITAKTTERIIYLIELKFSLYNPIREAIRSLFSYNILPQNLFSAQKALWNICDLIWFLANDKSTDFNYYTKRGLLAYVYSTTMLFWLDDTSPNFEQTKLFIRKQINKVLKVGKTKSEIVERTKNFFRAFQ